MLPLDKETCSIINSLCCYVLNSRWNTNSVIIRIHSLVLNNTGVTTSWQPYGNHQSLGKNVYSLTSWLVVVGGFLLLLCELCWKDQKPPCDCFGWLLWLLANQKGSPFTLKVNVVPYYWNQHVSKDTPSTLKMNGLCSRHALNLSQFYYFSESRCCVCVSVSQRLPATTSINVGEYSFFSSN